MPKNAGPFRIGPASKREKFKNVLLYKLNKFERCQTVPLPLKRYQIPKIFKTFNMNIVDDFEMVLRAKPSSQMLSMGIPIPINLSHFVTPNSINSSAPLILTCISLTSLVLCCSALKMPQITVCQTSSIQPSSTRFQPTFYH